LQNFYIQPDIFLKTLKGPSQDFLGPRGEHTRKAIGRAHPEDTGRNHQKSK